MISVFKVILGKVANNPLIRRNLKTNLSSTDVTAVTSELFSLKTRITIPSNVKRRGSMTGTKIIVIISENNVGRSPL